MGNLIKIEDLSKIYFPRPLIFTGGAFDLLHIGHADFLQNCKNMGKTLIVQISSDINVRGRKYPGRPIIPEEHRANLLTYLSCVDYTFISEIRCEDKKILDILKPDLLVLSDENIEEKKAFLDASMGKEFSKHHLKAVPRVTIPETGTSYIIKKIISLYESGYTNKLY